MPPKKPVQRSEFHQVRLLEFIRDLESTLHLLSTEQQQQQKQQQQQQQLQQRQQQQQQGVEQEEQKGQKSYFVPTLVSLCADVIASNFATLPAADTLRESHRQLYDTVIERLPTDIPLSVSVPRVASDAYWRRCCEARWSFGQLSERTCGRLVPPEHEGWKQFYLERVLSDFLSGLRSPEIDDEEGQQLDRLCVMCRDYVYNLELPCQVTRFDLYERLLARLPHVLHLRLTFGVNNVGTDFDRWMIGFGEADALNVRHALDRYPPLRSLGLPNNRLNSTLLKRILGGLVRNTTITVLDLSSNRIDDDGAQQLALLLCKPDLPLEELYLQDNHIRGVGAVALGEALTMNTTLRVLNLRLNRIPDEPGGAALVSGLASHSALEVLDLSHNVLGDATAQALADVLPKQSTLLSLNIAGNKALGVHTSELLLQALQENTTLRYFDARGSGVEPECLAAMERRIQDGVQAIKTQEVGEKEDAQRERIQQHVETKLLKTYSVR